MKVSLNTTEKFYTYNDIPLKLFMEIAESSNMGKLVKLEIDRVNVSLNDLYTLWENILIRNSKENNSLEYLNYFQLMQRYAALNAEYNLIKACLTKLYLVVDNKLIALLESMGYVIDKSSNEAYEDSIQRAANLSNNLVTKIETKANQLRSYIKDGDNDSASFEEVRANISFMVGFNVDRDLTLAEFNGYKKLIKERNKVKQKAHAHG